jgi:hypothetical protein
MAAASAWISRGAAASPLSARLLLNWTLAAALVLFTLVGVVLAFRRLTGALVEPLPAPVLVQLALGAAAALAAARLSLLPQVAAALYPLRWTRGRCLAGWLMLAAPSLALAALLAALMVPGTALSAGLLAWLFAAALEAIVWRQAARQMPRGDAALVSEPLTTATRPVVLETAPPEDAEDAYPAELVQQLTRTRSGGGEAIHAVLRADFARGEQLRVLHVSFCPPLDGAPRLEAFAVGEPLADAKVTHAYSFGARLEVQLRSLEEAPASVLVELAGEFQPEARPADGN